MDFLFPSPPGVKNDGLARPVTIFRDDRKNIVTIAS